MYFLVKWEEFSIEIVWRDIVCIWKIEYGNNVCIVKFKLVAIFAFKNDLMKYYI